jgi:hypothetical protein
MRAPRPRPLCSLVCVYLPREVFFCFFGFAGAVGVFAAPSGFGLLGDTCSSFGFGTPVDAVLRGRRSAVNGWNAQADPLCPGSRP